MTEERNPTPARGARKNEEGMALVLAVMVLLVLTLIGAALMSNVNTEKKISGLKVRDTQALQVAEAGVQEAMLRLRNGDIAEDLNPVDTVYIFNQVAGSVPAVGATNTGIATLQPNGAYLNYSTATSKGPATLAVYYKTKGGVIQRYDDTANPKVNSSTGNPIHIIQSTGAVGNMSRTIYAEVCRSKITVLAKGAVVAHVGIQFKGNIKVCGHNHVMQTPPQTAPPACDVGWYPNANCWWAGSDHSQCMPGAWSENVVTTQGSPTINGTPAAPQQNQTGFYTGPWDVFGMSQSDFWSWVGPPVATAPANPQGIYYLDNNTIKQDATGAWSYSSGNGEGLLYCDGDLQLNGNFTYKGLIYCEGDLFINGNCWILGGLVVKGKSTVKIANGSAIVLYSSDTIAQKISKYGGNMRTIAWREL